MTYTNNRANAYISVHCFGNASQVVLRKEREQNTNIAFRSLKTNNLVYLGSDPPLPPPTLAQPIYPLKNV